MDNDAFVLTDDESRYESEMALPEEIGPDAPRRFMLQAYNEIFESEVFMWGLQMRDCAIAFRPDGTSIVKAGSAAGAHRMFSRVYDLDLLWLDPPSQGG